MEEIVFNKLREIIYQKSGIALSESKKALLSARIQKRLRALGLNSFKEYLSYIRSDNSENELVEMLNVISTNVTSFFRDNHTFVFLEKYIEQKLQKGMNKIRIWSAACSSGQEPYSIAIMMKKIVPNYLDQKILATDISTDILKKAQKGIYLNKDIDTIEKNILLSYFKKTHENGKDFYHIKDEIKNMVLFKRINLSETLPLKGPLDIIFCRNVMIYFDNKGKNKLIAQLEKLLHPEGLLILGSTESLTGLTHGLEVYQPSIYIKK